MSLSISGEDRQIWWICFVFIFDFYFVFTLSTGKHLLTYWLLSRKKWTQVLLNEPSVALYHINRMPRSSMPNFVLSATSSMHHMTVFLLKCSCLFLSSAQLNRQKIKAQAIIYSLMFFSWMCGFISESVKNSFFIFYFLFSFLCLPLWLSLIRSGHISLSLTLLPAGMQLRWNKDYREQSIP